MIGQVKVEYTTGEVAKMFGVTRVCVWKWIVKKELRAHRRGRCWLVPLSALKDNADRWESINLKAQITAHNVERKGPK